MSHSVLLMRSAGVVALHMWIATALMAQEADPLFYQGYYQQYSEHDIEAALESYERSLSLGPSRKVQSQIKEQVGIVREQLAGNNLAGLMPADALAYVELAQPGQHLENIVRGMGLAGRSQSDLKETITVELDDGFVLSSDFQISPALLRELKKVQGLAVAITGMTNRGPEGIAVIHPGDSDLIRGLIETGMQVVPQQQSMAGHATYCYENQLWIVRTKSLIFCSPNRAQIERAIARLRNDGGSLVDSESFAAASNDRQDALVFAFVNGQRLLKQAEPHLRGEAAVARFVLDLDHLSRITLAVKTNELGVRARARVSYTEGHHSLAYGLIRTEPFERHALSQVPAGAAVVAALGINPMADDAKSSSTGASYLTGMDIGRELFANVAEVSLFVLPSKAKNTDEVPDFGIVVASNDANKSEALWNQLLGLPASMGSDDGPQLTHTKVDGRPARTYSFPDDEVPTLTVMRWRSDTLLAGTEHAIERVIEASDQGQSILNDAAFGQLIQATEPHTSKAVFANVGRILDMASQLEKGHEAQQLAVIKDVFQNLTVSWTSNEAPTELKIDVQASGLPQFADMLRVAAQMHGHQRNAAVAAYAADKSD